MPELYASGHFVKRFAVVEFEFGPSSKEILKFGDQGDLGFHPDVETSQLFVQLKPDVWKAQKKKLKTTKNVIEQKNTNTETPGVRISVVQQISSYEKEHVGLYDTEN